MKIIAKKRILLPMHKRWANAPASMGEGEQSASQNWGISKLIYAF